MSDLVEIYQDNIKTIFSRVAKLLDNLNTQSSEKSEHTITEAENSIREAERIVNNPTFNFKKKKFFHKKNMKFLKD